MSPEVYEGDYNDVDDFDDHDYNNDFISHTKYHLLKFEQPEVSLELKERSYNLRCVHQRCGRHGSIFASD